jgi:hypothetical protein
MSALHRKLRVGVTPPVCHTAQSICEEGIFQSCIFLVQLFNLSPSVEDAVLVKTNVNTPNEGLQLHQAGVRLIGLEEAAQTLDVVIDMSAALPDDWYQAFRARGGRCAAMRAGNDYVIGIERAMFDRPAASLCSSRVYDAAWVLPGHEHSCADYCALTLRSPVRVVPHLWTPLFLQKGVDALPPGARWGYQPGRATWRVCSFEANTSMVKTCLIPMLACEEAYRTSPAFLDTLHVCNALELKDHQQFAAMAGTLDVVRHGLASFNGRFPVHEFMAHYGDCIVSHHWENGQNYLYYEALYGGYPLIHNSEFIKDCGYYYPHFDCQAGGAALLRAFMEHDRRLEDEKRSTAALLHSVDVANPANIEAYTRELLALFEAR